MLFFKKKKEEKPIEPLEDLKLPTLDEIKKDTNKELPPIPEVPGTPTEQPKPETVPAEGKEEKPIEPPKEMEVSNLPLFIKIDRYQEIIFSINMIRSNIKAIKSSVSLMDEIERMRGENLKSLKDVLGKLENNLEKLATLFKTGPRQLVEEKTKEAKDLENLLKDLKLQIDSIKNEISQ